MDINWSMTAKDFQILLDYMLNNYKQFQFSTYQSPQPATETEFNAALQLLEAEINENLKKYKSPSPDFIKRMLKHPYFKNSSKKNVLKYCKEIIKQELDFLAEARKSYEVIVKYPEVKIGPEVLTFLSKGERTLTFFNEVTTSSVPFYNYSFPINNENRIYLKERLHANGALHWEEYYIEDFAVFDQNNICKLAFCTHEQFLNSNFNDSETKSLSKAGFNAFINQ